MSEPLHFRDLPPEIQEEAKKRARQSRQVMTDVVDALADRLPGEHGSIVRSLSSGGEEEVAMEWLVATLVTDRVPLSPAEHGLVTAALDHFGTCDGRQPSLEDHAGALAAMVVVDADGTQLAPPPGFDLGAHWIRRLASASYGRLGGHAPDAAVPYKTVFPTSWTTERIDDLVLDVARNPDEVPERTRGGGFLTRGRRQDVHLEVRLRGKGTILTGYPLSGLGVRRTGADGTPADVVWEDTPAPPPDPDDAAAAVHHLISHPFPRRPVVPRTDPDRAVRELATRRGYLHDQYLRSVALVDALAPRLPDPDARRVRTDLAVGEFLHLLDDLCGTLVEEHIAVSADEHALLTTALFEIGIGDDTCPFVRDETATLAAIPIHSA